MLSAFTASRRALWFAALACLALCGGAVDAATRTTSQTGNWSSSSTWGGATPPGDGDLAIVNHAVTVDTNTTVGTSPHSTQQTRPTVAATGSGGSLPAGAYRVKIVATSSYGEASASASSLQATITSGQVVRVTLPTLPPGASAWSVYLSQAAGAAGSERRYATGQAAGTFDCSSASWTDGTTTYAAAAALPADQEAIKATAKITIADGVKLTAKGEITTTADLQIDALTSDAGIEFDPTSSPGSGAAFYRLYFGNTTTQGTGALIMRGSSASRSYIRAKAGATFAQIRAGQQTSTSGNVRLDLQWARFSNLGGASLPAIDAFNNVASFQHQLTDVIFDADCRELAFSGQPATSGWTLNRVAFRQSNGNTYGARTCCVAFQVANSADVDPTSNLRTATDCAFEVLPPALSAGGSKYTRCYFHDTYANLPSGVGGTANSNLAINDSFWRKTYTLDTRDVGGNTSGNYLYFDNVTGTPSTDLNPHGIGCPANGATRTHQSWVIEYNGDDDSGDMFKSPGTAAGTVELLHNLIIPNRSGKSSGTIFTFPNNPNSNYRLLVLHNTYIGGPYALATSEGGAQPAGTISGIKSNLVFNIAGTAPGRYVVGKSDGNGAADTLDVVDAANVTNNGYWNLLANGNAGTVYNIRCTGTPGTGDVDLGDSAGADISTNGPQFVDPSRKFITWATTVLGASGTESQKITAGLNALKAVADTTSPDHVNGLTMDAPAVWVRDGFRPRNALLKNAGHDGATIGALEGIFSNRRRRVILGGGNN